MAHVGQELALGPVGRLGLFLGPALVHFAGLQLRRSLRHLPLDAGVDRLDFRLALGDGVHFPRALPARPDEKHVFKSDPADVFQPAPGAGDQGSEHRPRPEGATDHVIQCDHHGSRDHHAPVPVERQKGQRAEDVKMHFDAAAAQVDQQRPHEHLGNRDDLSGRPPARSEQCQPDRQADNQAPQEQRHPDVQVGLAVLPGPGSWRGPQGEHDSRQPLKRQQSREQAIGATADLVLVLEKKGPGSLDDKPAVYLVLDFWFHGVPRSLSGSLGV